jgi:hypothetical protein
MKMSIKISFGLFIFIVNGLAIWDIQQRSEEALKLEYTLIIVSVFFVICYIIHRIQKTNLQA